MDIKILKYEEHHYPSLAKVWEHRGWPPVPKELLPSGYIAEANGTFVAALFMYMDLGKAGFIDWAVGGTGFALEIKDRAFALLFSKLEKDAIANGCKMLFSMTKVMRFKQILSDNGMVVAEEGATTFIKPLVLFDTGCISD